MPWANVPESKWSDMEDCVKKVMAEGKDKESATAICYTSIMGKEAAAAPHNLLVFKQADGQYRWVTISSNSYRDRDGEIVSQAALEADCERADKEQNYGPLRWWHVGQPDPVTKSPGPGLDLGVCDFNAMYGRMLVESGTFDDAAIAEKMMQAAGELAVSSGFFHPLNEPDAEGTYSHIHRFERSLLPAGKAANAFTSFLVAKEAEMATLKEKLDEFLKRLGGDEKLAERVMATADAMEKEARDRGVAFKEEAPPPPAAPPDAPAPATAVETKAEGAPVQKPEAGDDQPQVDASEDDPPTIGDLTVDEFAKVMAAALQPLLDALGQRTAAVAETQQKEQAQSRTLAEATARVAALEAKVKEMEGDQPRNVQRLRASEAPETVVKDDSKVKAAAPHVDPLTATIDKFILGGSVPPA